MIDKIKIGDIIKIEYGRDIRSFKVIGKTEKSLHLKNVWFFGLLPGFLGKIVKHVDSYSFYNFYLLNPKYEENIY